MRPSAQAYTLIAAFEGFAATPYRCPAGLLTIGYGHVLHPQEKLTQLTQAQAMLVLKRDAEEAAQAVRHFISVPLTQYQFDALVSFTFNLGSGALQRSALRRKINRGEYEMAAEEFLRWIFAGGKRLPGLLRRRLAESELYLGRTRGLGE